MKKINSLILVTFGIISAVLLNSCVDSVNTVENANKTMTPQFVKNKRVITDGYLRDRLEVVRVDRQTLPDGLLKIQVTLRSNRVGWWDAIWQGSDPYNVTYRFTWLDKDGMEVQTASSTWVELEVMPGEVTRISSISPNERCKDFVLNLRELDD